ncbi:MAG: hypothetical protein VXX99_06405 [Bacteroidota bacterium]|nr:hypothetical protein [Bacteroidota bacterium]
MTRKILLLWVCLFSVLSLLGQMGYDVQVAVDTTKMRIGEKIEYTLQVKADSTSQINFAEQPFFAPFEVLEESSIDTIKAQSNYFFTKKYALIQFDSGAYWLPPQKVIVNGFSKITDSLLVHVANVPVDTLKQKLFDIKPLAEVEQNFDAIIQSIVYGVLTVLLFLSLIYAFFFAKNRREESKKKLPPFERAIEELKALETFTPSLQEEYKQYYSRLTDVVRRYLEDEAKITALESTTDELLSKLESLKQSGHLELERETIKNLKTVLQTADLVKFARSTPEFGTTAEDRKLVQGVVIDTKEALPEPTPEEIQKREEYRLLLAKKRRKKQLQWGLASVVILMILSFVIAIGMYGYYPVRDTLVGYPTIQLKNREWVTSQYGTPPVKISTPKVLRRVKTEKGGTLRFSSGNYDAPFYIDLVFTKKTSKQEGVQAFKKEDKQDQEKEKVQELINAIINDFQSRGAVNILIKEEEITTLSGIPALKIFGTLDYPKKGKSERVRCNYTTHVFDFEQGGINLTLLYEKEDRYGELIEKRVMDSFELIKEL